MQKKTDERVRGRAMETEETIRAREAGWIGKAGSEEIRLLLRRLLCPLSYCPQVV